MIEKHVGAMKYDEFMKLIDNFIETQSSSDDPLPAETFFDLWAEIEREQASSVSIDLPSAESSFRRGWQEVMSGKTMPLDEK